MGQYGVVYISPCCLPPNITPLTTMLQRGAVSERSKRTSFIRTSRQLLLHHHASATLPATSRCLQMGRWAGYGGYSHALLFIAPEAPTCKCRSWGQAMSKAYPCLRKHSIKGRNLGELNFKYLVFIILIKYTNWLMSCWSR